MGDIIELIQFSGFLFWMGIGLCMVSLLIFRKTKPNANRPIKVPIPVVIIVLLISTFLSVTTLITDLSLKYIFAIGAIFLAVVIYTYFVYKNNDLKCMGKVFVHSVVSISCTRFCIFYRWPDSFYTETVHSIKRRGKARWSQTLLRWRYSRLNI